MTDLSQVIRWNANFVRGLAQSVLERARVIRSTLKTSEAGVVALAKSTTKRLTVKKAAKRAAAAPKARATNRKAAPRKTRKG
jgi:hypothetical protein